MINININIININISILGDGIVQFIDKTEILIRNSQNKFKLFNFDKDFIFYELDSSFNKTSHNKIIDGSYSFADICLDINDNDIIYGVIDDKKGKLINITIDDDNISSNTILKYDYKNYFIKFPYIKDFYPGRHVFFYSLSKYKSNVYCLNHIYINNDSSKKHIFNLSGYNIISNFTVTWDDNIPTIFYYNIVNGVEELFVSKFDIDLLKWSQPQQITSSRKQKIYLSILKDTNNTYHIVFSENNNNQYYCKYIKGHYEDGLFNTISSNFLSQDIMSLFPHLIMHNSKLYAQWIQYHTLYTCTSKDLGESWSNPTSHNLLSESPLIRYEFRSNCYMDRCYNLYTFFSANNSFHIDDILPKY